MNHPNQSPFTPPMPQAPAGFAPAHGPNFVPGKPAESFRPATNAEWLEAVQQEAEAAAEAVRTRRIVERVDHLNHLILNCMRDGKPVPAELSHEYNVLVQP